MKSPKILELKIVAIGNSRGVRLPKEIMERYAIADTIVLEIHKDALVFRNKRDKRLSWEDTFKDMAREREDWSNFEGTVADGRTSAWTTSPQRTRRGSGGSLWKCTASRSKA